MRRDSVKSKGAALVAVAFLLGSVACYTVTKRGTGGSTALWAQQAAGGRQPVDRFHQVPCPPPPPEGEMTRNLVFAGVGDGWSPDMWSYSENAGWDLVAVYFGNRSDWSCPECKLALRMPDAMKWQMVWALMTQQERRFRGIWSQLSADYDYVMVADDDLIMDACTIRTFFDSMRRHKLLVAQPSNCRGDDSDNPYWVHWQLPNMELHYVNVIECTAPGLDMRFLNTNVKPLLENTFSGWGLPYCFWAAAGFSRHRLAAIDAACMIHPARPAVGEQMSVSERIRRGLIKPGSIYARFGELTPFKTPLEEQRSVWKQCGYTTENMRSGRETRPNYPVIMGTVLLGEQANDDANPTQQRAGIAAAATAVRPPARQQLMIEPPVQPAVAVASHNVMLVGLLLGALAVSSLGAARWRRHSTPGRSSPGRGMAGSHRGSSTPPRTRLDL